MLPENVFECGRVCASVMSDFELVLSFVVVLAMLLLMIFDDTRPVRWLKVQAGKVMDWAGWA